MLAIVDTGVANVGSMLNMFRRLGVAAEITREAAQIAECDGVVLPGVGAFDPGMQALQESGLVPALEQRVLGDGVPLLGVCLGLQLLTRGSEEGRRPGLGWLEAEVVRFRTPAGHAPLRVPHMGWNDLAILQDHALLRGLPERERFYFVHSFHLRCGTPEMVLATCRHGVDFPAVVAQGHLLGTQFHPEKSLRWGMALLRNFAALAGEKSAGAPERQNI